MSRRSKLTSQQWAYLARLYATRKHSLAALAALHDLHLETVRKGFILRGVKLNPPYKTLGPTGRRPKYY